MKIFIMDSEIQDNEDLVLGVKNVEGEIKHEGIDCLIPEKGQFLFFLYTVI